MVSRHFASSSLTRDAGAVRGTKRSRDKPYRSGHTRRAREAFEVRAAVGGREDFRAGTGTHDSFVAIRFHLPVCVYRVTSLEREPGTMQQMVSFMIYDRRRALVIRNELGRFKLRIIRFIYFA
jgi:hypothetical protein